jgi:hypothetical protein
LRCPPRPWSEAVALLFSRHPRVAAHRVRAPRLRAALQGEHDKRAPSRGAQRARRSLPAAHRRGSIYALLRLLLTSFEPPNVGAILIAVGGLFHDDEVVEPDDRERQLAGFHRNAPRESRVEVDAWRGFE